MGLTNKEFLTALKDYIEEVEHVMDSEWGSCRTIEQLLEAGVMPAVYHEVVERLRDVDAGRGDV